MIKCKSCGKEIENSEAAFCPYCGEKLLTESEEAVVEQASANAADNFDNLTKNERKVGGKILLVLAAIVLFIAIPSLTRKCDICGKTGGVYPHTFIGVKYNLCNSCYNNIKYLSSTIGSSSSSSSSTEKSVSGSSMTTGQKNALGSAQTYLRHMAFSRKGLIEQLEYEGYTTEEATYAVDHCGADWSEQAVKSAATYLKHMSFSRQGLIEQLEYEGFTHEQAVYGAEQNGY